MKMKNLIKTLVATTGLTLGGMAFAATGGGATIHNVAKLNFDGGEVTAWVNVEVATIASAPTITAVSDTVNSGETATIEYTIISNSNGSDNYTITVPPGGVVNTDVGAPGAGPTLSTNSLTLAASIVLSAVNTGADTGTITIPAGSEANFTVGDTVHLNGYLYEVTNVATGTIASTSGNTTTAETHSVITLKSLTNIAGDTPSPAISNANTPAGTQVGEVGTFTITLEAGDLDNPGTPGDHTVTINVTTSETDEDGNVVTTPNTTGSVSVLSGDAVLTKEVRNLDPNNSGSPSAWYDDASASTLTAKTGEVLEYRLTASSIPGETVTGAVLQDSIPPYTTYVANSTTLNGNPVADVGGTSAVVGGLSINTVSGNAGELIDGEEAVVIFQVTVD